MLLTNWRSDHINGEAGKSREGSPSDMPISNTEAALPTGTGRTAQTCGQWKSTEQ